MSKVADLEAKLDKLTRRQCQILYLVCHGKTLKQIGQEIGYEPKTVEAEMTFIYKLFDLGRMTREEKRRVLLDEVCPIHSLRVQDPKKDCTDQIIEPVPPNPDPAMLALVVRDAKTGLYPLHKNLIPVPESRMARVGEYPVPVSQPRPRSCLPWTLVGILSFLLIAALILLVEFYWVWTTMGNPTPAPVAFATEIATAPPVPSSPTTVVTQPPAAISTLAPTWTPSPIPNTPTPSVTLVPTPKPLPTSSVRLPFTDSFNRGIRPEWTVVTGQPLITDSRLRPGNDILELELGNNFGNRYVVDFDYYNENKYMVTYQRLYVMVAHRLVFSWGNFDCSWEEYKDDKWNTIWEGKGWPGNGHFKLTVTGNTYTIPFPGNPTIEITYGTALNGPLGLKLKPGAQIPAIANFSIKSQ